jgi:hypothetical protein
MHGFLQSMSGTFFGPVRRTPRQVPSETGKSRCEVAVFDVPERGARLIFRKHADRSDQLPKP